MLETEPPPRAAGSSRFDVFLSYKSHDRDVVERIAEKLARSGLQPWFDRWCLTPGGRWQEELAEGLGAARACAVFIGPDDVGDWEREELAVALDRAATDRAFRLFLVLLPGLPEPFDASGLSPFLSTRTWVDFRPGLDNTRSLQGLVNAIKGIPLGPAVPIEPRDEIPPYRGLRAFHEEHAEFFFGRDADVQRLVEKLKASSFLAVLGPSGSGKSSLARAGLVPALRRGGVTGSERWRIVTLRPGAHPLDSLAGHLLGLYPDLAAATVRDQLHGDPRTLRLICSRAPADATRILFLIDQFEELFTLCRDEHGRRAFLLGLLHAATADGPSTVVLTLRADFYPRCAAYPELAQQLAAHQFLVGAMSSDGLRQAIDEPARHVGLEFEAGLVDTILEDVLNQPGALPLLEHALFELWERRRGRMLTLEAYQESGGVTGALAKRADGILAAFPPEEREIVRRVLLRLTQPGEGAEDTRRRAPMSELVTVRGDSHAVESVVDTLADARLLTTGQDAEAGDRLIEVSHEALIRSWPQLRRWVEEDRQGLRIHRRLTEASEEWRSLGRDPGALYRGARLGAAREWADEHADDLNELEREFLAASASAEVAELDAARRRARRARAFTVALAVLLAGAAVAAVFAVRSAREANEQRDIASSGALAGQAVTQLDRRPDLSLLLAMQAYETRASPEARDALVQAIQSGDGLAAAMRPTGQNGISGIALSPDDRTLAVTGGEARRLRISLWDLQTGRPVGNPLADHGDDVIRIVFSPDGRMLASSSDDDSVRLWEVPSGRLLATLKDADRGVAFSPDSKHVAVSLRFSGISVLDTATRREVARTDLLEDSVETLAFSPDGRTLISGSQNQPLQLWTFTGDRLTPARPCSKLQQSDVQDVAFNPADDRMVALTIFFGGGLALADLRRCRIVARSRVPGPVAFSPDGDRLAAGSADGQIQFLEAKSLEPVGQPLGHYDHVGGVAFTRAGQRLISAGFPSGVISVWDLSGAGDVVKRLPIRPDDLAPLAVSPDGRTLASATGGAVALWDVRAGRLLGKPLAERDAQALAFSPDGRRLAIGNSTSAQLSLWDVATQKRLAIRTVPGDRESIEAIAFRDDGRVLASAGLGGRISQWSAERLDPVGRPIVVTTENTLSGVVYGPGGSIIVCDSDASEITQWDPETGKRIGEPMSGCSSSLAVSPDGRTLAAGAAALITMWDLRTRRRLGEPLAGHSNLVMSVDFSSDGRTLASTEYGETKAGGKLLLWDVASRRQIGQPVAGFDHVAFSRAGGELVASGRPGGVARMSPLLWRDDVQALRRHVCSLVGRTLTAAEQEEFLAPGERADAACAR